MHAEARIYSHQLAILCGLTQTQPLVKLPILALVSSIGTIRVNFLRYPIAELLESLSKLRACLRFFPVLVYAILGSKPILSGSTPPSSIHMRFRPQYP